MKKFTVFLVSVLVFCSLAASVRSYAVVTTQGTTEILQETVQDGKEEGMVRGEDISVPVKGCIIAVCAVCVYGVILIRKNRAGD